MTMEETSDLLDKMMPEDKKDEHRTKSAGDVLAAQAPKDNFDPEEHKKLAHVGKEKAPSYLSQWNGDLKSIARKLAMCWMTSSLQLLTALNP